MKKNLARTIMTIIARPLSTVLIYSTFYTSESFVNSVYRTNYAMDDVEKVMPSIGISEYPLFQENQEIMENKKAENPKHASTFTGLSKEMMDIADIKFRFSTSNGRS